MAITTLAGAESGIQYPWRIVKTQSTAGTANYPRSLFYGGGFPAPAAAPSSGVAGTALTTYAGQIPFTDPASGNTYLSRLRTSLTGTSFTSSAAVVIIADRLWHNSGLTPTVVTSQTVNSVTWPARDINQSINGEGVLIGMEVSTAFPAGTQTYTINYTNSGGTAGRTGSMVATTVASAPVGTFYPFGLASGDTGVKSIEQFTASASVASGVFSLVAYRPIAAVTQLTMAAPGVIDAITGGFPQFWVDSVPFFITLSSASISDQLMAELLYSQG